MTTPRWTGMGTFGLGDLIDSQAPKSSQEFPRVPKSSQEFRYKFALNVQGALGARDAHVSIHFSLGAITSAKKRLKCNSMASVFPSFSHVLPAERLSSVPRASHPSSWMQESWLLPSPANTHVRRSDAKGVHQIPGRSRKCRSFALWETMGKPEFDCSTLPGTWENETI